MIAQMLKFKCELCGHIVYDYKHKGMPQCPFDQIDMVVADVPMEKETVKDQT